MNANARLNISGTSVPKAALQPFDTLHNTYRTHPVGRVLMHFLPQLVLKNYHKSNFGHTILAQGHK